MRTISPLNNSFFKISKSRRLRPLHAIRCHHTQLFTTSYSGCFPPPSNGVAVETQRDVAHLIRSNGRQQQSQGPGSQNQQYKPPPERTLKLGKTIRILHDRLPTLLVNPLPQEILCPHITLRLFPSTHPHLPVVSGRIAYTAALWTSPMAWGRVPVVGNVKLDVLSERMVGAESSSSSPSPTGSEKLVVRWKTGRSAATGTNGVGSMTDMIRKMLSVLGTDSASPNITKSAAHPDGDFHGLFIFEFDGEGRINSHTIEHAEQGNVWDHTARVISVTDWLLGKGWKKEGQIVGSPEPAFCNNDIRENHVKMKKKTISRD